MSPLNRLELPETILYGERREMSPLNRLEPPKTILYGEILNYIHSMRGDSGSHTLPATSLARRIEKYAQLIFDDKKESFDSFFTEEQRTELKVLNITPELFHDAIENSKGPTAIELRDLVLELLQKRFGDVLDRLKNPDPDLNPWFITSFLYAIFKIDRDCAWSSEYSASYKKVKDILIEKLFDLYKDSDSIGGWSNKIGCEEIMLYDTAYVGSILIKILPNHSGDQYEKCLKKILDKRSENGLWEDENYNEIVDYSASAYCWRFISNYLKYRDEEYIEDIDELNWIWYEIYELLLIHQKDDGHWPALSEQVNLENEKMVEPLPLDSNAVTAVILSSLRSASVKRGNERVVRASDWLLDQLHFDPEEKIWCWGEMGSPDIITSALSVSSLLRALRCDKFPKANLVVKWLADTFENAQIKEDPHKEGVVLCTLADFLLAWKTQDFFDI